MTLNVPDEFLKTCMSVAWAWDRPHWSAVVQKLGLIEKAAHVRGQYSRTDYRNPLGIHTWAQWLSDRVVGLKLELVRWANLEESNREDYERVLRESEAAFSTVTKHLREVFGSPIFEGRFGEAGFPHDQSAELLALWQYPSVRMMVQWLHGGATTPIAVVLVFAPPS